MAHELQQLGIRIDQGEDVKASEVKDAYEKEIERTKQEFQKMGKGSDSPEAMRYLMRLEMTRDRLLGRLDSLKKAQKEEGKKLRQKLSQEIRQSLEMREQLEAAKKDVEGRRKAVADSVNWAERLTNPDASGARIPDYEGWGWAWQGPDEDENSNNPTRWTLAGWLAAFARHGNSFAEEQMQKAVKVFEESDEEWDQVDEVLEYDEMIKKMDMQRFFDRVKKYNLASESMGFAAGYLAVSMAHLKKEDAAAYEEYFFGGLENLKESLVYENKENSPEYMLDFKKGRHQVQVLSAILSPKEWIAQRDAVRKEFLQLSEEADTVRKNLGLENFKDPAVRALLARDRDTLLYGDLPDIEKAREQIRKEAFEHVKALYDGLDKRYAEVSDAADLMFKHNETVKHFSEEDIAVIKKRLEYAKKEMKKIEISEDDSFDDMGKAVKKVHTSEEYIDSIAATVAKMEQDLKDEEKRREEEEKRRKEEEERRTKEKAAAAAVTATGAGAASAGAAGAPREKKEAVERLSGLEEFLREKNLKEAREKGDYLYHLGYPDVSYPKGVLQFDFKNPEVQKQFGDLLNTYLVALSRHLPEKDREKLENRSILKEQDIMTILSILGATAEISRVFRQAMEESTMQFPGRPTLARLEKAYEKTFVPAWERAGKRLGELVGGRREVKEKKERPAARPGGGVEIPRELHFLGPVYLEYVAVMSSIARHGNDPEGVAVAFPFSPNLQVTGRFRRFEQGGYILNYTGGSVRYPRIEDALHEINKGVFHQRYMDRLLRREAPYEKYEDMVGNLDKLKNGRTPGEIYMEFDWNNPDPDVYARALPHGRIVYTVARENVGPYGEDYRSMWADSFDDFMKQLRHIREWGEGPKHPRRETANARREILFNTITNSLNFRQTETQIGRVVQFEILDNEVVTMRLDWGGGNNALSPQNALLNVWVDKRGALVYTINGPGAKASNVRAANFNAMIAEVARRRTG